MFVKRDILLISSVFLFFVCLISPPFPALHNKPKSRIYSLNFGSAKDYLERGNYHFNYGKYDLAIADYSKVIEVEEHSSDPCLNRGTAYLKQEKYDLAIADYNKAIDLNSRDFHIYNNRGNINA